MELVKYKSWYKDFEVIIVIISVFLMNYTIALAQLTQFTNDTYSYYHLQWSPDGTNIACVSDRGGKDGIWLIPVSGDTPSQLNLGSNYSGDFYLAWSPDGSTIAFDAYGSNSSSEIWTVPASGGNSFQVTNYSGGDYMPSWTPDGSNIVFLHNGSIYKISKTGSNLTHIYSNTSGIWHFFASPDGSRILFTKNDNNNFNIWTVSADGTNPVQITTNGALDDRAQWSPNSEWLAFDSERSGNRDIWIIPSTGGTAIQVTQNPAFDSCPTWSPDGTRIAFSSERGGNSNIWIVDVSSIVTNTPINDVEKNPDNFNLMQNYPNPFNPSTKIKYYLPSAENVLLEVYDLAGRHIKTLVNQHQTPGNYLITWDSTNSMGLPAASGIYFYKIKFGTIEKIKRMLLIR